MGTKPTTTTDRAENALVTAVRGARTLEQVREALIALQSAYNEAKAAGEAVAPLEVLMPAENIPFGGDEPADTFGVWSWDEGRLLVGASWTEQDLRIVSR